MLLNIPLFSGFDSFKCFKKKTKYWIPKNNTYIASTKVKNTNKATSILAINESR